MRPTHRGRTALDLVEQARPVAGLEEAVGAGAEQEQLLQRVQRVVDRSGTGEGAVILALPFARAAMLLDARELLIAAQKDEGKRFVVAEQHVVGGAIALDELRFEQQRLRLVVGRHHRHRPALRDHPLEALGQVLDLDVVGDAALQRTRLADIEHVALGIEHPVDAGRGRQRLQHVADRRHACVQIGRIRAAHGEGGLLLVEAGRGAIAGHDGRCRSRRGAGQRVKVRQTRERCHATRHVLRRSRRPDHRRDGAACRPPHAVGDHRRARRSRSPRRRP